MATRKQKQDLIQALKFTPRNIEITLSGYGGEIIMGRISEAAYEYWKDRDDLADFVYDWNGEFEDVPADARFVTDGSWYDVDDICHENGCEASDCCWITVEDKLEGRTIWETNLGLDNLASLGVDTASHSHYRPEEDEPSGTCVFMGQSIEKGTFFSGTVRITQPFDPKKLLIHWNDCDGWKLISAVEYNGEEVEGYDGYSTTGKGSEFRVYQIENDNEKERDPLDIPILEGEEMWAQEAIDSAEPETWEGIPLTPWWSGDESPMRRGEYEIFEAGSNWPFPQRAQWTGKNWKCNGKTVTVKQWRGLCEPAE